MRFAAKEGGVFKSGVFLAVFLLAAATLSWMLFLPRVVSSSMEAATGYRTEIEAMACNPLGFDLRAENLTIRSNEDEPWVKLAELEATASSPFAARNREFDTLHINAEVIRFELDERRLFNLAKLISGLQSQVDQPVGIIEVKAVTLEVDRLEIVDFSGPSPKRQTVRMDFKKGPYPAHSLMGIFQPLLEEAAKHGFRPL